MSCSKKPMCRSSCWSVHFRAKRLFICACLVEIEPFAQKEYHEYLVHILDMLLLFTEGAERQ